MVLDKGAEKCFKQACSVFWLCSGSRVISMLGVEVKFCLSIVGSGFSFFVLTLGFGVSVVFGFRPI